MLSWLMIVACSRGLPARFDDCSNADCRVSWVVDAWPRDPAQADAALQQMDALERLAATTRLVDTYPGKTEQLCARLAEGAARYHCQRANSRPHLRGENISETRPQKREDGGPSGSDLPAPSPNVSPYAAVAATRGPCEQRVGRVACYDQQARRDLKQGSVPRAVASCQAIDELIWRQECFFTLSEVTISSRGAAGLSDANDLCLGAGPYASNCLAHVLVLLAIDTPDATDHAAAGWPQVAQTAAQIERYWGERTPEVRGLYTSRYWSEVMSRAYARTPEVTGGPLATGPAAARPQGRAAAAYRLVQLAGVGAWPDLAAWEQALTAALARRSDHPARRPGPGSAPPGANAVGPEGGAGTFLGKPSTWPGDEAGDASHPATWYWGTGRRTYSPDPAIDQRICLLEAFAQVGMAALDTGDAATAATARARIEEAWEDPDPAVSWTAERLLSRTPLSSAAR